jgi:hypothetical protein
MRFMTLSIVVVGLLAALATGVAIGVELRDAQLVGGGAPELQNGSGTVRILSPRLGGEIFVPEPRVAAQLGVGIAALALTMARRRKTALANSSNKRGPASAGE